MHKALALAAAALLLFPAVYISQVDAQDRPNRRAIGQAYGPLKGMLERDKNAVDEVVAGLKELEGKLDYLTAIDVMGYFDECDDAWDPTAAERGARGRPIEAYKIAKAILDCVRSISFPEEALKFGENKDVSDTEKFSLRPRIAMIDAIAQHASENEACMKFLTSIARDQAADTDMRILAVAHLGQHSRSAEALGILTATLRDRSWRVRDASIEALVGAARHHEDVVIVALINALADESGKLRQTLRDALNRITGARLGTDADEWGDWYRKRKSDAKGLPEHKGGDRGTRVRVFETESFSDRYVFVIDTSKSMLEKVSDEEMERIKGAVTGKSDENDPRRPLDWSKINNKLDLAREEIIRSLEVMDPERTRFTVIGFAEDTQTWKEELVPTDKKHVEEVAAWLRAIKGGKQTNLFAAMNTAYDLSEKLAGVDTDRRRAQRRPRGDAPVATGPHRDEALPDTIFLYTDGWATTGKYSGDDTGWARLSPEEKTKLYHSIMGYLLDEISERNRIARITVNAIGIGRPQDHATMRGIATRCGGKYVPIGR